MLSAEQILMGL